MSIKFPVRIEDGQFLVGADCELISGLPDATAEEREEIVRTMNTGAAASATQAFADLVARMQTEGEAGGFSWEDACSTLNNLITSARAILKGEAK